MDSEWQEEPKNQRHASTPGAELAAQREALGMTVDQIADQLKLAPRQVLAIEKGDYDALPNMAVTRGFIRAYAKAVRLDPAPLVAMIEVEDALGHAAATVRPTRVAASFNESRFPTLTERQGKPLGAIIGGIAVVALLAAAGAWKAGLISPATFGAKNPAVTNDSAAGPASAPLATQPAVPAAEQAPLQSPNVPLISVPPQPGSATAPATVPGAGVNPPAAQPAPAAPGAVTAPAVTPAAPAPAAAQATAPAAVQPAAVAPAAAAAAAAPAVAGGGKLVLKVNEDSWVEIRRPGSNALIARLVKAGNTETFDVRARDLVIVGKPSGVQATLQGAPLELPSVPGGTIARVNIK